MVSSPGFAFFYIACPRLYHLCGIKVVVLCPLDLLKNVIHISWDDLYVHNFQSKEFDKTPLKVTGLNVRETCFFLWECLNSSLRADLKCELVSPLGEFWTWNKDRMYLYCDRSFTPTYLPIPRELTAHLFHQTFCFYLKWSIKIHFPYWNNTIIRHQTTRFKQLFICFKKKQDEADWI